MPKLMPTLIISGAVFNAVDRIRIHSPRNQVRKILLRIIPIQPPKRSSTPNTNKVMKRKPKTISKEKALIIASNPNQIQITKGYTESELREVLRHLNLSQASNTPTPPQTRINTNIQTILNIPI